MDVINVLSFGQKRDPKQIIHINYPAFTWHTILLKTEIGLSNYFVFLNLISSNAFSRTLISTKFTLPKVISNSRFPKLSFHEKHFPESLFSEFSFPRVLLLTKCISSKIIFPNSHFPE